MHQLPAIKYHYIMGGESMTDEKNQRRREYRRKWAKDHPEKLREYRKNHLRRAALAEMLAARTGQKLTKEGADG